MINLHDIRYCRVGVSNLDEATRFATDILGLDVAYREPNAVYFKSDDRDHTMVYFRGDPKDHTVAFEAGGVADLELAAVELGRAGVDARLGTADECEQRHVGAMLAFQDPSGGKVELVVRPHHSGVRYHGRRDAGITGFSHVGLSTTNPARDEQFWTQVCNARVSDRIGDIALMRVNAIHHTVALAPGRGAGIHHINHQVGSNDDVLRSYYHLSGQRVPIVFGPGRHPTSGARFLYFQGPDGMVFEYSVGVDEIEDEETHRPRQFGFEPSSLCMWGAKSARPR